MSDSEDDYMKDDFLKQIPDVKPGIAKNREQKRQLKIFSNQDSSYRQVPKRNLEVQRRNEALSKPIPETNKGFSLMAKMGYKSGMALGKDSSHRQLPNLEDQRGNEALDIPETNKGFDLMEKMGYRSGMALDNLASTSSSGRILEPIDIKVKLSRTGLGHEQMENEQQKGRCEAHLKRMEMNSKMSEILATDYRKRKRNDAVQRILIADIMKSRKACQDLDLRCGIEEPSDIHLWPVRRIREEIEAHDEFMGFKKTGVGEEIEWKYIYSNGAEAPAEEDLSELDDDVLLKRLEHVTKYVRTQHFYCVWCGAVYDHAEELEKECPGPTKESHD